MISPTLGDTTNSNQRQASLARLSFAGKTARHLEKLDYAQSPGNCYLGYFFCRRLIVVTETGSIGVHLTLAGRLKPQLYKQNPPARVTLAFGNPYGEREGFAYKTVDFSLVRAGGLSFCSRDF